MIKFANKIIIIIVTITNNDLQLDITFLTFDEREVWHNKKM